jgi:hypothetical protein
MVLLWTEDFAADRQAPLRGCKRAMGQPALSGFRIDGRLREATQESVGFFFFRQCVIEQADRVFQPKLARQVLRVP